LCPEAITLNERHGFGRAVNGLPLDGFTGCGKNSVLYQGTTLEAAEKGI
jgi:hypothetical protein